MNNYKFVQDNVIPEPFREEHFIEASSDESEDDPN